MASLRVFGQDLQDLQDLGRVGELLATKNRRRQERVGQIGAPHKPISTRTFGIIRSHASNKTPGNTKGQRLLQGRRAALRRPRNA